jgi:predicted nucleic acid-binding protein
MSAKIYILDTNVISDIIKKHAPILEQIRIKQNTNILCLTQPVEYEILRGLFRKKAVSQLRYYQTQLRPKFQWLALTDADWQLASQFWADAVNLGRQLADTDLLIAAIAKRLGGILVSADNDFDALPILRENWRIPT